MSSTARIGVMTKVSIFVTFTNLMCNDQRMRIIDHGIGVFIL